MTVGVVLLDLNQSETTLRCLHSLAHGDATPELVVLVENGSSPVSRDELRELDRLMDIVVLRPDQNLGCAGGRNLGLNYLAANTALSRYIVLDNDTVVSDEFISTIQEMAIDSMEVIAPVITDLDEDTIWSAGGRVEPTGSIEQLTTLPTGEPESFTVDWSPGACLIFNRTLWEQVGEFDEWMDFFFEDIEWCLRVAQLGGKISIHRTLKIEHEGSLSLGGEDSPTRTRFWARNGTVFRLDTLGVHPLESLKWILRELTTGLSELRHGRVDHSKARIQGLAQGIRESIRRYRNKSENDH